VLGRLRCSTDEWYTACLTTRYTTAVGVFCCQMAAEFWCLCLPAIYPLFRSRAGNSYLLGARHAIAVLVLLGKHLFYTSLPACRCSLLCRCGFTNLPLPAIHPVYLGACHYTCYRFVLLWFLLAERAVSSLCYLVLLRFLAGAPL